MDQLIKLSFLKYRRNPTASIYYFITHIEAIHMRPFTVLNKASISKFLKRYCASYFKNFPQAHLQFSLPKASLMFLVTPLIALLEAPTIVPSMKFSFMSFKQSRLHIDLKRVNIYVGQVPHERKNASMVFFTHMGLFPVRICRKP